MRPLSVLTSTFFRVLIGPRVVITARTGAGVAPWSPPVSGFVSGFVSGLVFVGCCLVGWLGSVGSGAAGPITEGRIRPAALKRPLPPSRHEPRVGPRPRQGVSARQRTGPPLPLLEPPPPKPPTGRTARRGEPHAARTARVKQTPRRTPEPARLGLEKPPTLGPPEGGP